jgi:hypothetical protein
MSTETVKIDRTQDIKAGMAALWDAANKQAVIMPAAPTNAQIGAFMGIFNANRVKLADNFDGTKSYSDQLAVVTAGSAYVKVDGAVEVGDLLEFSATVAGSFTKRMYMDLNAAFSDVEIEAEIQKQAALPRIKALAKGKVAGDIIKVMVGSV